MTDVASSFSGSIPEYYDTHMGPAIFEPYAADLAQRLAAGIAGPVLETACGTGILTRRLRAHLEAGTRLVATDLSAAMLDYARTRLADLPGVEWREADAAHLPFSSSSFAAVVCQLGLMFVPDKAAAMREARRVARFRHRGGHSGTGARRRRPSLPGEQPGDRGRRASGAQSRSGIGHGS